MEATKVLNLTTGKEIYYTLPPEEAVKAAYLQGKGVYNTWDYDNKEVPLVYGKNVVTCGDFTALVN
ncbi:MAG: hypothetical protein K9L17_14125 [Clostridiales bacterium]|nr:hypothetical protein [Clostridiales bacterium]MCF8023807.1 hypothetical protein [Clostridiales bacterium]